MITQNVFENYKLVPVAVFESEGEAMEKLAALIRGGLPVAEMCFRTDCAEKCIKRACREFPEMLTGAGTVINAEQCERAIDAGAKFVVSPGLSEEVAAVCSDKKTPYFPGIVTPTEIMRALKLGITALKFFPAENFGGLKTVKALAAAFPQVKFMPTGGVNESNVLEYLAFSKVMACGGSFMLKGTPDEVEQNTARAVSLVKGA